ncbi:hypothetical protein K491DRAFT_657313 [Lophiostoma macrostomum CBS 122681]|uniref:Uncharacterized protein n=1 Tax=Lophiostoma macrostomum CBS 122681 TaxID=1314788 RepID=A0A6A6T7R6_9PLEO|nr:hypothetical protein K491DRAFT_657313 [Lophiostoma macrostomum CBS 122681]
MAGYGQLSAHAHGALPSLVSSFSLPSLPTGACNHRDSCGCVRFWDQSSADLHGGSGLGTASRDRSTLCVCGHHACFHREACPAAGVNSRCSPVIAARDTVGSEGVFSQLSVSGLPPLPSVCLLSNDQQRMGGHVSSQNAQQATGLGLTYTTIEREHSASPTKLPPNSLAESEIPSTRAHSFQGEPILHMNNNLHLDVPGDTIPNTYNMDDFIQSATEIATPSITNTPDLRAVDQAVQGSKALCEALRQFGSPAAFRDGSEARSDNATSAPGLSKTLSKSPAISQEHLRQMLESPQLAQKLLSYATPLYNLLNSMPNVASFMRELQARIDRLDNQSFDHGQLEEIRKHNEDIEARQIDIENRLGDYESAPPHGPLGIATVADSFASNHSVCSNTSALVLSTIDRNVVDSELCDLKARIDLLEAAAMPSVSNPWEVEVVFLPWGPELRGVWVSKDDLSADSMLPESEEWTQSRNPNTDPGISHSQRMIRNSLSSGQAQTDWSSQAISEWATESTKEWLVPKACGGNNLAYKRLESRGLVRSVTFTSANSRDIQATLATTFGHLIRHLKYTPGNEEQDAAVQQYPGLRASFVPLRKVPKQSRLQFLTPSELSNSSLWSAQFLASGIIMRVHGGKRRLYVTERSAYIQHCEPPEPVDSHLWTWQDIRLLPRFQANKDTLHGGYKQSQPEVAEADAKEPCWSFYTTYDLPPVSTSASFASNDPAPVQLSMRPADREWRRSITPSSILKTRQLQPISPLSEKHPIHPLHQRTRTSSASFVDQAPHSSSKRRLESSPVKHSSVPYEPSRAPSVFVQPKRRRVNRSSSPGADLENEVFVRERQETGWSAFTGLKVETPSPLFANHPGLARSNSDAARSERSAAIVGKATPTAYATPYSGPLVGPVRGRGGFGSYDDAAGDTEPDDDYEYDDDEQSWHGYPDDEDEQGAELSDAEGGAEMEDLGGFLASDDSFDDEEQHGAQRTGNYINSDGESQSDDEDDDVDSTIALNNLLQLADSQS